MNFFPKTTYQKKTALEATEIRRRLNKLLTSVKYEGSWENDCLVIQRNNEFGRSSFNKITSRITLQIVELENERMVSVVSEMKPMFEFQMGLMIVLMGILQLFMIYVMIANHTFNIVVFAPVFFLLFLYFIFFMCNLWDSDGFRYDLNKVLK
jgi:ABC-type multidrug transport system fused ATPase/permease subunit